MKKSSKEWYPRRYWVRATYVDSHRHAGKLAFETWHSSESSRDIELQAARSRTDVSVTHGRGPDL